LVLPTQNNTKKSQLHEMPLDIGWTT